MKLAPFCDKQVHTLHRQMYRRRLLSYHSKGTGAEFEVKDAECQETVGVEAFRVRPRCLTTDWLPCASAKHCTRR